MAILAPDLVPADSTDDTADTGRQQPVTRTRRSLWGYLAMPALLGLAALLLYLWVQSQELDSIERRRVNSEVIYESFVEHIKLSLASTVLVLLIAIPLGVLLTRPFARWATPTVVALANIGQMVPSIGVLVLLALYWKIGFEPAVVALVAYSALPVLRNTMVGIQQVDPTLIEAGRGMGMTKAAVLRRIELPLAVPVMLAGVRTALVINVGAATLATFINGGGLGDIINAGITTSRDVTLITGAVLTAILALSIDWIAGLVEDLLRPKGL